MRIYLQHSSVKALAAKYDVGFMLCPSRRQPTGNIPSVADNQRYQCYRRGLNWDAARYVEMLGLWAAMPTPPLWAACPDVVGNAAETFTWWSAWSGRIEALGLTPRLVVQDGMTPQSVKRKTAVTAVFVGGTTKWKWKTLPLWCEAFDDVHVGRVNTSHHAKRCTEYGVASIDGSGWFRTRRQRSQLFDVLSGFRQHYMFL